MRTIAQLLRLAFSLLLLCGTAREAGAQLCQGSLGDPILHLDFGAGPNPGPPLAAAATGYSYVGTSCPGDGSYTVRNAVTGCNNWHAIPSDHTGDPGGYFMLVNASSQPSAFYVDTVVLACSNTTFEMAVWVMNVNNPAECGGNPNQPNLTFRVEKTDGSLLQTYNSGNIAPSSTAVWKQYGFYFTLPPGVNKVVIRIINNAPGGCGNDLALDDITFRPCGPLVGVGSNDGSTLRNFCVGDTGQVIYSSSVTGTTGTPYYQWQRSTNGGTSWTDIPGANAPTLTVTNSAALPPGTYLYRLAALGDAADAATGCRVVSGVFTVRVNTKPTVSLSSNGPVCAGGTLQLTAGGGTQYQWSGPGGFSASSSNPQLADISPAQAGYYVVQVTNNAGCSRKDSLSLVVNPRPAVVIPGAAPSLCRGDTVQLWGSGTGTLLWTPAAGLSSATVPQPLAFPQATTRYRLTATSSQGCQDTASVLVTVLDPPAAGAGPDRAIVAGQSVVLLGTASGSGISWSWSPATALNDAALLQPSASPGTGRTYVLTVSSACGVARDSVDVIVYKDYYVPNAFTPNGDGRNDSWRVQGLAAFARVDVRIYNRHGQLVFQTRDPGSGWDGTFNGEGQPAGAYVYTITLDAAPFLLRGWLLLVR